MSRCFNEYEDYDDGSLEHHGVLGMKWGVRRYQNADGSLTDKGKKRYYSGSSDVKKRAKGYKRRLNDTDEEIVRNRRYANKSKSEITNANKRFGSAAHKVSKLKEQGKDTERVAKKMARALTDREDWQKAYSHYESEGKKLINETNSVINKARSEGMTVNSKSCIRWEGRGRATVTALVDPVSPVKFIPIGDDMIPSKGTSYSVKAKR